ncbi:MAG: hypothetical protein NTW27_06705 [Deltaproteobacteria bacterium]|nr:hypothetical protein [Deltaproteobacteria bacterium]
MIIRQVLKKDTPVVKKALESWIDKDPGILGILEDLVGTGFGEQIGRCWIMEIDRVVHSVCLWIPENADEVRILALGLPDSPDDVPTKKFLREQILEWAEMGVKKARISVPHALVSSSIGYLRSCGFMFEGMSSSLDTSEKPVLHFCKHFLYRSVPQSQVMDFLREFLIVLGYEIRPEQEGFGYRIRSEFRLPFIFSPWHRVTQSGSDIIIHPPARVLEPHEVETFFFPLNIMLSNEKPLLLTIESKNACDLIDLPDRTAGQNSLFGPVTFCRPRSIHLSDITYTHPGALKGVRKGLPLLFYVNGAGAVGSGRVEDWDLDKPENLCSKSDQLDNSDLEALREHAAGSGSMAGKVLVIRFDWYRPFKKTVMFEEIRKMDEGFNPQHTRALSRKLFQLILERGNAPD